jgi:hypothetical protein
MCARHHRRLTWSHAIEECRRLVAALYLSANWFSVCVRCRGSAAFIMTFRSASSDCRGGGSGQEGVDASAAPDFIAVLFCSVCCCSADLLWMALCLGIGFFWVDG